MRHLIPALVAVALAAACSGTRSETPQKEPARSLVRVAPPPTGRIPGTPAHADDFRRGGPACICATDPVMKDCKCLHCVGEPGAACYCGQGKPRCLCGIDMPECRCMHCAGREGKACEVCPCDHSATRAQLEGK